jgi:hypothetical protein
MKGQLKGSEQRQQTMFDAASIIGTFVLNYMRRKLDKKNQLNEEEISNTNKRSASIGSEEATSEESYSDEDDFALYANDSPNGGTLVSDDAFGSRSPSPILSVINTLSNSSSSIIGAYVSSDDESELDGEGLAEEGNDSFVMHYNENAYIDDDSEEDGDFTDTFMDNNPLDNSEELNIGFLQEDSTETDPADDSFSSQGTVLSLINPINLFGSDLDLSGGTDHSDDSFI